MFLAIRHDPTLEAFEDQKLGDKDLNGFSVLIDGDIAHVNRRLVRLESRRNDFDDLALNSARCPQDVSALAIRLVPRTPPFLWQKGDRW